MISLCRWVFATAALALVMPASAEAQRRRGSAATETPEVQEARQHFEAGVALMEVENWEGALVEFERSLGIHPTRSALFNLGMCQKALFRYPDAMVTFERYLAEYSEEAEPRDLRALNQNLEELRRLLGEVIVGVSEDGATVTVDGREVGVSPLPDPVRMVSGRHVVAAEREGFHRAEREVVVTAGDRLTTALELRPASGEVVVEANVPGAAVYVDGQPVGSVPYRGELLVGEHEVRVEAEGYGSQAQTVAIALGDRRTVSVTLVEPSGTDPAWFWSMFGVTVAAGLATAALGGTVMVRDEEYRNDTPPTDEAYQEGRDLMLGTDVCLGITAAAALATVVLAFTTRWDDESSSDEAAPVEPTVGFGDGGLAFGLAGRF